MGIGSFTIFQTHYLRQKKDNTMPIRGKNWKYHIKPIEMTHYEKLDMLLNGLLSRVMHRNTYGSDYSILTFEFLCSNMFKDENVTPWEVQYLQDRLIEDEYVEMIEMDNVLIPNITQKGIKFIQNGGYGKEKERIKMQDEMTRTTIESNNRSKQALTLSYISMFISFAALVLSVVFYLIPHKS